MRLETLNQIQDREKEYFKKFLLTFILYTLKRTKYTCTIPWILVNVYIHFKQQQSVYTKKPLDESERGE